MKERISRRLHDPRISLNRTTKLMEMTNPLSYESETNLGEGVSNATIPIENEGNLI